MSSEKTIRTDTLEDAAGGEWLREWYVERLESTHSLARLLDTYPNRIRRALLHHGIEPRSLSAAQKLALETGRHPHPTRVRTAASRGTENDPPTEKPREE